METITCYELNEGDVLDGSLPEHEGKVFCIHKNAANSAAINVTTMMHPKHLEDTYEGATSDG